MAYTRFEMDPGLASTYLECLPALPPVGKAPAEILHYDRGGRLLYREPTDPARPHFMYMYARVGGDSRLADIRVELTGPHWKLVEESFLGLDFANLLQLFETHVVREVVLYENGLP